MTILEVDNENNTKYTIQFENKMYIGMVRTLNLVCNDI